MIQIGDRRELSTHLTEDGTIAFKFGVARRSDHGEIRANVFWLAGSLTIRKRLPRGGKPDDSTLRRTMEFFC